MLVEVYVARKFVKNVFPLLRYHNPQMSCEGVRSSETTESSITLDLGECKRLAHPPRSTMPANTEDGSSQQLTIHGLHSDEIVAALQDVKMS